MTSDEFLGASGESVYHYTTLAAALEHILPTRKLLLSPFSTMRDPRESRQWGIMGIGYSDGKNDSLREDTDRWNEFNRQLQERKSLMKVLSLTRDDPAEREQVSAAFGRGFAHPRLWEQYANNHHGVCLCFDLDTLIDELSNGLASIGQPDHGPVVYEDAVIASNALTVTTDELRARGVPAAVSDHVRKHIGELFFTKLKDWETEREYRFVIEADHPDPIYVRVKRALRAVILGAEVSRVYEPAFGAICDPAGVHVLRVNWVHAYPHLAKIGTPPDPTFGLDTPVLQIAMPSPSTTSSADS
jgi:Protein of unknown function (DUF2971)